MSFRYTNQLVGMLQHRLRLESAHRQIVRETYKGWCNGIEVTCTGYGTVLDIKMVDKAKWEPFYRCQLCVDGDESANVTANKNSALNLPKISADIQAAVWSATEQIRSAKEAAHRRSMELNRSMQSEGNLRHWYTHDANSVQPRAFDGLANEAATPWMQAVRFRCASPEQHLQSKPKEAPQKLPKTQRQGVSVLTAADCDPLQIPIASVHPLYTASLIHVEEASDKRSCRSAIDGQILRSEYKREMHHDELLFWERVEQIRRSQLASISGGVKRGYKSLEETTVQDQTEEKVALRFTQ